MDKLHKEYEKLILNLHSAKDHYGEDDVVIQMATQGSAYNNNLMVVGRAVNGWKNGLNKHQPSRAEEIVAELKDNFKQDGLEWVDERWGVNDGKYNSKKSAFWRVNRRLANHFSGNVPGVINTLVWSNLYKVAQEEANPSVGLKNVIFDSCLKILKLEIEIFKPKNIVFLTGYHGWAGEFIKGLGVSKIKRSDRGFVSFVGTYNGINIVIGEHPQGKKEDPHVNEILKAFKSII